jgi:hypothetical protein
MFYLAGAAVVGVDLGAGVDEEDLLRARPACKHARFISSSPRRTKKRYYSPSKDLLRPRDPFVAYTGRLVTVVPLPPTSISAMAC